jgi:hypothetical protein
MVSRSGIIPTAITSFQCGFSSGGGEAILEGMSRAFVNDDAAGEALPEHRYPLPPRDDPAFPLAAARALLNGANVGDSMGAEAATGYPFGAPALVPQVQIILADARDRGDERMEQLAERFLRRAGLQGEQGEPKPT